MDCNMHVEEEGSYPNQAHSYTIAIEVLNLLY